MQNRLISIMGTRRIKPARITQKRGHQILITL